MKEFEELRIRLRRIGTHRYLAVANGAATGSEALRIGDEPAALRAEYNRLVDIELRRAAKRGADVEAEIRELGRRVFALLFGGELGACLTAARAAQGDHGLRLRFDLPPELADLPVEIISAPPGHPGLTFAFDANLSLARTVHGGTVRPRMPAADDAGTQIAALVAVASPNGLPPIDAGAEIEALKDRFPEIAGEPTVLTSATRASIGDWLDAQDGPAMVLLIAHGEYDAGGIGRVLLETDDGGPDPVPGDLLSGLLVKAKHLRLVLLSLCHSARGHDAEPFSGLAQSLIARGVPAVLGMSGLVSDEAARVIGPHVVVGLCANKSIDEAVIDARGRVAYGRSTAIEWGTPTLFLHEDCGHGWLFKARRVVRERDTASFDFLDRGRLAEAALIKEASGPVTSSVLLNAAKHRRYRRDWEGVIRAVRSQQHPSAELKVLHAEADLELAWPQLAGVCASLAGDGDPKDQAMLLGRASSRLPAGLRALLESEVDECGALDAAMAEGAAAEDAEDWSAAADYYRRVLAARPEGFRDAADRLRRTSEAADLAARYTAAADHDAAGRWRDAAAAYRALLDARPDGYLDAAVRAQYAEGRAAETDGDWTAAAEAYAQTNDYADAAARLAYAHGRTACASGDWTAAADAFSRAAVSDADQWRRYAAARAADAEGDWAAVTEHLTGIEEFEDAGDRLLLAAGRLALQAGDWRTAVDHLTRVPHLAEALTDPLADPLNRALTGLYGTALAAEESEDWTAAADAYAALPDDYEDASDRRSYCAARAAEADEDWERAAAAFRATAHRDAQARSRYADGRAAESRGDWERARAAYADSSSRDTGRRLRYVAGRAAYAQADWHGTIAGFADLPDEFASGEVGRRRRYARAAVAAGTEDWAGALALLGDARDDECEGRSGRLRARALGAIAESRGDWAAAARHYEGLDPDDADREALRRYALLRSCVDAADWDGVLDHAAALPEDHRDVERYRRYAAAKTAFAAGDWSAVLDHCRHLPTGFADADAMADHARLRAAETDGDWPTVTEVAGTLGGDADAAVLKRYAEGRVAEGKSDWSAAAAAFHGCAGHGDSAVRAARAEGRGLEETGRWNDALATYAAADPHEAATRRARLERLRTALPWAETLLRTALVADPIAAADPAFPYTALAVADITPDSDAAAINRAPFAIMRAGRMTSGARLALDRLRDPGLRLLVDAQMYWVGDPLALGKAITALDLDSPTGTELSTEDLMRRLRAAVPDADPLLGLLAGDRAAAVETWRRRLRAAPDDLGTAHHLAVASLWQAEELEAGGAWEQAEPVWTAALACWTALIDSDRYWTRWREARAAGLGRPIGSADTSRLRIRLGQHLVEILRAHEKRHARAGRAGLAERRRELIRRFEAEMEAARALREAGGLDFGGEPFTCGPGYLELTGRQTALADLVQTLEADPDAVEAIGEAALRRLRWSFSELSESYAEYERHRYEAALKLLPAFHLLPRAEQPEDCTGPAEPGHPGDCPHCRDFLHRNPSYAHLRRRRHRLLRDAAELAVRAHLSSAYGLLSADGRIADAMDELRAAVEVAANAASAVRTRQDVLRLVLGRAKHLASGGRRDTVRVELAIGLLESAAPLVRSFGAADLNQELSRLLVDRALHRHAADRRADVAPMLADTRRALDLWPESIRAAENHVRFLLLTADALGRRRIREKLELVVEALERLEPVLEFNGITDRARKVLDEPLDEAKDLNLADLTLPEIADLAAGYGDESAAELARRAVRALAAGDITEAVDHLIRAVRLAPGHAGIRAALLDALRLKIEREAR